MRVLHPYFTPKIRVDFIHFGAYRPVVPIWTGEGVQLDWNITKGGGFALIEINKSQIWNQKVLFLQAT